MVLYQIARTIQPIDFQLPFDLIQVRPANKTDSDLLPEIAQQLDYVGFCFLPKA